MTNTPIESAPLGAAARRLEDNDMSTTTTLPFAGTAVAYYRGPDSYGFANPSSGRGTPERESADALRHAASKADQPGARCAVAIHGRTFTRAPHTAVRGNVASLCNGRTFTPLGEGTIPAPLAAFIVANGGTVVGAPQPQPQPPTPSRKRAAVKLAAIAAPAIAAVDATSKRGKAENAAATLAAVAAVKGSDARSRARAAAAAASD